MKKPTTIIPLFLLTAISVNGQNDTVYQSVFGQHLSEWITAILVNENERSYGDCIQYYSITGDESQYEGYHPMQFGYCFGTNGWYTEITCQRNNEDNTYYLREDESHARLYMRKEGGDGDILLMDLALNVGDTFHYKRMDGHLMRNCVVDSVFYDEGRKHVRLDHSIYIEDWSDWSNPTMRPMKLEFVEGVGPNLSPFYCQKFSYRTMFTVLLCYSKDSVSQYGPLPIFGNVCYLDWPYPDSIGEVKYGRIGVQMDSETGLLTLSGLPEQASLITLCDISGRTLIQTSSYGGVKQMNIAFLPSQVYIITVRNDTYAQTFKILKP